jgi:4'-phosphopantetheinyl transferase
VWERAVWEPTEGELSCLSAAERAAADRLRCARERRRLLARRVFVRQRISGVLGIDPSAVAFGRAPCPACGGPNGRPLVEGAPRLSFSCTSSGDRMMLALGPAPLGVDLEAGDAGAMATGVLAQLHPLERLELEECPPTERAFAFLRLWTRKEACLKAIGTGIAHGVADPYIGTGGRSPCGLRLLDLPLDGDAVASLAVRD